MFAFFVYFKKSEIACLLRKYTPSSMPMNKVFRIGVLSVAMCLGVSAGSLKADFEADLLSVLSFVFSEEEAVEDPLWWLGEEGRDADAYCCKWRKLYRNFCKEVHNIVQNNQALRLSKTELAEIGEKNPDAFAERAFCLLKLSLDLYAKVSKYASATYDFDEDNGFKNVEPLLLSECRYVFVRRILELSRFVIRHHVKKLDLGMFVNTKDRKPDEKILAEILKPFAKGDAYQELQSNNNDSQLVQSVRVLSKVFNEFLGKNGKILGERKKREASEKLLRDWFGVKTDYHKYVLEHSEVLSIALQDLSQKVWDRVKRMLSVKGELSAEQQKEALPFFKGEKDVGELLKAAESFRIKEKEARKAEQEAFAKANVKRENLKGGIIKEKRALKAKKGALSNLQGSDTEISDKKKKLEDEIQEMNETVKTLLMKINKLPYPSVKSKHEMQRKAANKGIAKDIHDAAVFANYVQLPDKCGAFQNAFLYYQAIMWNVFTDALMTMREHKQQNHEELKVNMPELTDNFEEKQGNHEELKINMPKLTDDFEEEYNSTVSLRASSRKKYRSSSFDEKKSKIGEECEESVVVTEKDLDMGFIREDERERGKSI